MLIDKLILRIRELWLEMRCKRIKRRLLNERLEQELAHWRLARGI